MERQTILRCHRPRHSTLSEYPQSRRRSEGPLHREVRFVLAQPLDDVVNAVCKRLYISGIDCGKHRYAKLISTEFAIRLGIDDLI